MSQTFYGKWSLLVTGNVKEFEQRVRIQGSTNADGIVVASVGAQIPEIDGVAWQVTLERSGDHGATWHENVVQRITTVSPQNGWTVTLYGDDSVVKPQDSDVTIQFVYLDPLINPKPVPPPFHFTAPRGSFLPPLPPRPCECCCLVPCRCRTPRLALARARRGCC
jgi:hypothetical protein